MRQSSVLVAILLHTAVASAATLEGVVVSQSGPLQGAIVSAYRTFVDFIADKPAFISKLGDKPGFYRLRLPRGKYYLVARGTKNGKPHVSYHGANPISVERMTLWLPFMAVPQSTITEKSSPASKLRGVVTFKDHGISGAQVSLYSVSDRTFRGLGLLSGSTATDGTFEIRPEEGTYVVIARKRRGGRGLQPLKKGDLFCFFSQNPVVIPPSKTINITLPCYPKQDLQTFMRNTARRSVKRSNAAAVRFRQRAPVHTRNGVIRGRVFTPEGKPVLPGISRCTR
jgi:hypothetical protein